MSAFQNLIRLEIAKNSLQNMLQRFGVTVENDVNISSSRALEEHVVNGYKSHPFFNFQNLQQNQYIPETLDLFIAISHLKHSCSEYMQKRYSSKYRPLNPNIIHVLDSVSFTIVELCSKIFKILDENFIEERNGIIYFNLKTKAQEYAMIKSSANFLLIKSVANLSIIETFFQIPKCSAKAYNFVLVYIADVPQTSYLQNALLQLKDENVIVHIYPTHYCLGLAKPIDNSSAKPALSTTSQLFCHSCRCRSKVPRKWICINCKEFFTTESSGKPSCKCGKYDINKLSFKCFNKWHGSEFIEEKVENLLQTFVTTVFGCSSSAGHTYDSIEMGQEIYELNEIKNDSIIQHPESPTYTVNIKISNEKKSNENERQNFTMFPPKNTTSNIQPPKFPQSFTTVDEINDEKVHKEPDTKKLKQRSIISNDTSKYLKDKPSKTTNGDYNILQQNTKTSANEIEYSKKENLQNHEKLTSKEKELKKVNIAVIGQSGVGKSTLLNAIANYLKYETAKDAYEKDNLEYIIPCQFKVFYPDFSEKLISIGMPDENEKYEETVLSTTQECKEYSFEFNGYKINFIDTPGLSDTSGIEKDAKNLEKIRTFICSSLDSLHAICFVVKANEARMDLGFSNSMNDLLSIFPKSALSKVIFFMTHSRGTLYGPGDSMTPLKIVSEKLFKNKGITFPLTSENVFCVDNESFLFLCAKNQGIEYSGASFEDFENSWKKSKLATQRFFNKITTFKPFNVGDIKFLKDLEKVLMEQKAILSSRATPERWFYHFLTAKTMDLIETGNTGQKYLNLINMDLIEKEANYLKNFNIKNLETSEAMSGIPGFLQTSKTSPMPETSKFVQNHLRPK
uniref:AAA+ ATPase domain-containing protein n=1 Tax=Panagrolaimus davidi TaxID=227884 RepID=A0A914QMB6_9BILA